MFFAMEKPSHHRVEAGRDPPATVGAPTGTVFLTTAGVDPSSSINPPTDDPHISAIANSPASQIGATAAVL